MKDVKEIVGDFTPVKARYGIAVGRFNGFVVESLLEGAVDALVRHGVDASDIEVTRVPGAFELPLWFSTWHRARSTML